MSEELQRASLQIVARKTHFRSTTAVPVLRQRIYRDWLRGVYERTLSAEYQIQREGIEDILRDEARGASGPRLATRRAA